MLKYYCLLCLLAFLTSCASLQPGLTANPAALFRGQLYAQQQWQVSTNGDSTIFEAVVEYRDSALAVTVMDRFGQPLAKWQASTGQYQLLRPRITLAGLPESRWLALIPLIFWPITPEQLDEDWRIVDKPGKRRYFFRNKLRAEITHTGTDPWQSQVKYRDYRDALTITINSARLNNNTP